MRYATYDVQLGRRKSTISCNLETTVTQRFGLDYSEQWDVLQHHVASLLLDGGGESDMEEEKKVVAHNERSNKIREKENETSRLQRSYKLGVTSS